SGMMRNGICVTLKISESRKTGRGCSLSDILETDVDEKYYLSDDKTAKLVAQLTRETEDGFHAYRDDAKKSSIQGTHVTYPEGRTHALTVAHVPMTNAEPQMLGHVDIKGNDSIDRKSTRLNSSHVSISYAVFCLKKK